jgi:hypothetical protein
VHRHKVAPVFFLIVISIRNGRVERGNQFLLSEQEFWPHGENSRVSGGLTSEQVATNCRCPLQEFAYVIALENGRLLIQRHSGLVHQMLYIRANAAMIGAAISSGVSLRRSNHQFCESKQVHSTLELNVTFNLVNGSAFGR